MYESYGGGRWGEGGGGAGGGGGEDAWCSGQHVCFPSLPPMLGATRGA